MIWAAFGGLYSRLDLIVMKRNKDAPKQGYLAKSYLQVLEKALPTLYKSNRLYMQENTLIHTAKIMRGCFKDNAIRTIKWPFYFSDQNPQEYNWMYLKHLVYQLQPYIYLITSKDEALNVLDEAQKHAWECIPQRVMNRLVETMPHRIAAVIEAHSWWTKY